MGVTAVTPLTSELILFGLKSLIDCSFLFLKSSVIISYEIKKNLLTERVVLRLLLLSTTNQQYKCTYRQSQRLIIDTTTCVYVCMALKRHPQ